MNFEIISALSEESQHINVFSCHREGREITDLICDADVANFIGRAVQRTIDLHGRLQANPFLSRFVNVFACHAPEPQNIVCPTNPRCS